MRKSMMGYCSRFLLPVVLFVAVNRANAATIVTVNFSGTATGSSHGTFQGDFQYDQSQLGSGGTFPFTTKFHAINYSGTSIPSELAINAACGSYTITTSGTKFTLVVVAPKAPATTVTIILPSLSALSASALPACSAFPGSPATNTATFKLTGGTTFTGNITSITCPVQPAPAAPSMQASVYASVYAYPAPQSVPVYYACQPRPACCLTRLFARRSHRSGCW